MSEPKRFFIRLSLSMEEIEERISNDFPELLDGMVDGEITYRPGQGIPEQAADAITSILRDYGQVDETGRTFV